MTENNDTIEITPEGFPVEGNIETLKMMQPVYNKFVCTEKILTCATINLLSVNLENCNCGHSHNSNFLVMPSYTGKTSFLVELQKGNQNSIVRINTKYLESDMYSKYLNNKEDFINKTWISYNCAPAFTSISKKQLNQLIDFYCNTLSDGVFNTANDEIYADYNLIYAIRNNDFYILHNIFQERGLLERVFPIFFYLNSKDDQKMADRSKQHTRNYDSEMPVIILPRIDDINDGKKISYIITEELNNDITCLTKNLQLYTYNSLSRCQNYIHNFLASNAMINNRISSVKGKKVSVPNKHDIKMFKWIIDVHDMFKNDMLENVIYKIFLEKNQTLSISEIVVLKSVNDYLIYYEIDEDSIENSVKIVLNNLVEKGLLKKHKGFYYSKK